MHGGGFVVLLFLLIFGATPYGAVAQDHPVGEQQNEADYGYLRVQPVLLEGEVVERFYLIPGRPDSTAYLLAKQDSLRLPSGEHQITLSTPSTADITFPVLIQPGETIEQTFYLQAVSSPVIYRQRSSFPVHETGSNVLVRTEDDAQVFIGGEPHGMGEQLLDLPTGIHQIRVVHPGLGTREQEIEIEADELLRMRSIEFYLRPDGRTARRLGFIPGASQFYKQEQIKGTAIAAGFTSAVGLAVLQHQRYHEQNSAYMAVRKRYFETGVEESARQLGDEAQRQYREAERIYWQRNVLIAAAISLYATSFWNSRRPPTDGYRQTETRRVQFAVDGSTVRFTVLF